MLCLPCFWLHRGFNMRAPPIGVFRDPEYYSSSSSYNSRLSTVLPEDSVKVSTANSDSKIPNSNEIPFDHPDISDQFLPWLWENYFQSSFRINGDHESPSWVLELEDLNTIKSYKGLDNLDSADSDICYRLREKAKLILSTSSNFNNNLNPAS